MTSENCSIKKTSFKTFTQGFFRPQSANSLKKEIILYLKYGIPVLLPVFLIIYIAAAYKSFFFNYRSLKKS
jgi:hypothetical protein